MSDADTKNLEAKVAKKVAFLKKVTEFAQLITEKRGKLIHRIIGSCHTHTIHELKDFDGFSFLADIGQSSMGGNTVKIWFNPRSGTKKLVLEIDWPIDIDEYCRLKFFDDEVSWQHKIQSIIRRHKTIAAQIDRTATVVAERNASWFYKARRAQELVGRARMLLLA